MCYYFDDIIKIKDFDFIDILLDEKSYENILIYYVLYRTLIGAKPLCIMFDKVDGFIRNNSGTEYLVLFGSEKYNTIFNRIRCFLRLKSIISYIVSHDHTKINNFSILRKMFV